MCVVCVFFPSIALDVLAVVSLAICQKKIVEMDMDVCFPGLEDIQSEVVFFSIHFIKRNQFRR